ncbi:serine protease [Nesidiocoris tenuis]|uniref:Serine protease n=1 Tax=Nesidiocoris tenuis TaxID=355587 RepID=A0ABN7BB93_9HEMI|nr:serine protease [Nesidiocoris tenuis]
MYFWLLVVAILTFADAASLPADPIECQFLCDETRCIENSKRCNGVADCDDLSDENGCVDSKCEFMCDVTKCIENTRRCDGVDDCADLTDERNCLEGVDTGNETAESKTLHHILPFLRPKAKELSCLGGKNEPGHCVPLETCVLKELIEDYLKYRGYFCVLENQSVGVCCPQNHASRIKRQTTAAPAIVNIDETKKEPDAADVDYTYLGEPDVCGFSTKQLSRVSKPQAAGMRDYPWIVALMTTDYFHYCGGVIIDSLHILTAAHCVPPGTLPDKLIVRVGEYDFRTSNDSQVADFGVARLVVHEEYDTGTYENDIALLRLKEPITYGIYVQPVCLPTRKQDLENDFRNTTAVVAGWGTTEYGGPMSDILMEVPVPIWDQDDCVESFIQTVFESAMCAAGKEGGKDSCQGDSGGPLVTQREDNRWMTIGVVSWGIRCGEKGKPGVYTRVNQFIPWIASHLSY